MLLSTCLFTEHQRSESRTFLITVQEITFKLVPENGMTSESKECLGQTRVLRPRMHHFQPSFVFPCLTSLSVIPVLCDEANVFVRSFLQ
jgi:hypothetical protein